MKLYLSFIPDLIKDFLPFLCSYRLYKLVMLLNIAEMLLIYSVNLRLVTYVFLCNIFLHGLFKCPSEFFCELLSHLLPVPL